MVSLAIGPGCSNMLELRSTLLCVILLCCLPTSLSDTLEARAERGSQPLGGLDRREEIHSRLFRRSGRSGRDAQPQQPPPGQLTDLDDLGPQRPGGQTPRLDRDRRPAQVTPREILLGQLSNRVRRDIDIGSRDDSVSRRTSGLPGQGTRFQDAERSDIDIGPQRPTGQVPPTDLGPQRPNGQHPPKNDGVLSGMRGSVDLGPQRPSGQIPPSTDLGPQRPQGQHPPKNDRFLSKIRGDVDLGPQRPSGQIPPSTDLGPQRPQGQHPPKNDRFLSKIRGDVDLGPQRPSGQIPPSTDLGPKRPSGQIPPSTDLGPQRPQGQHPPKNDRFLSKVRENVDLGPQRPSGQIPPSTDLGPQRPNGQIPPSTDLGPQRPSGQHSPQSEDITSNDVDGKRERFRREVRRTVSREDQQNDEMSSASGEAHVQDDSSDNDIEVSPYTRIVPFDESQEDANGIHLRRPQDLGPHRPMGSIDPNGPPMPPTDLGPQRPSGQHPPSESAHGANVDLGPHRPMGSIDPNGPPMPPTDLGPQRPSGQQPPTDSASQERRSPSDLGPHRPMGSIDPNGPPMPPTDLGPQRPSGQHPPSESAHGANVDLGPHRPMGSIDPNGPPMPPTDLGPQRPSGQQPPTDSASQERRSPSDLGPHRPMGSIDPNGPPMPPTDLGPQRPSGQHPPSESAHGANVDLGPHRPMGSIDPNGPPMPPTDLGPHRPSGQQPPTDNSSQGRLSPHDLGPNRPMGSIDPNGPPMPPTDLGPQRPSGQHPPSESAHGGNVDLGPHRPMGSIDPNGGPIPVDLGPQRPSGQHPPAENSSLRIARGSPASDTSSNRPLEQLLPSESVLQKIVLLRSPPSDLGPHRPSGNTDPNGIPAPPSDLGPQRPSGQHPPSTEDLGPQRPSGQHPPSNEDLGPHRPSGQHPPESSQKMIQADPVEDASQKLTVLRTPPSDLGPHRPSGNTDPNGIPSPPSDLGPQRPSGQHPPTEDVGPQRPSGQHPPSENVASAPSDLGPHRPSGSTDPNGIPSPPTDLGPQRPSGQHPPEAPKDPLEESAQTIVIFYTPPSDLGPQNFSGSLFPNGIPPLPIDFGPRPSLPPYVIDSPKVTVLHGPSVDLGPQRPSGGLDPNGPALPSDLGPGRPFGQLPSIQTYPMRIEPTLPALPIDLGPHRPAGMTDPNVKPGQEDSQGQSDYKVYWNVPTFMCHKHGYGFRNLSGEYGIVQNPNDEFRGPELTILYDPGMFPALLQDDKGKKFLRNGGVPQEGDLQKHLAALEESIEEQVPKDFDGLGVIDFEAWRPVWAQNWGTLNVYRTLSMELEKRRDPSATRRALEIRAKARFEAAARVYFEATIQLAQQLRPGGRWGFYGFPHCFNQVPVPARPSGNRLADYTCASQHQHQNDKIDWLWKASNALYPSVYLSKANKTAQDELAFVSGRLTEARRVAKGIPVYAYVWYRYHDTESFLTEEDLWSSLHVPRQLNLAGTILWGSSSDLNNREKCARFSKAVQESLGPAAARATGRLTKKSSDSPTVIFATRR